MKKSEVAEIFNKICGVEFPFFNNNFKLSSDKKKIDRRREILSNAKENFRKWQKEYEDYLYGDSSSITPKGTKVDSATHLINAYNKARIEDNKAVIINILNQWFNMLVFAGQLVDNVSKKECRKKLWKEYNDGKWINEDIANILYDCFERIKYNKQFSN